MKKLIYMGSIAALVTLLNPNAFSHDQATSAPLGNNAQLLFQQVASQADQRGLIAHQTTGCGGAVVFTPKPGNIMSRDSQGILGVPDSGGASVDASLAKAARNKAVWLTVMDCTLTGRTHILSPATKTAAMSAEAANASGYQSSNWSGYQIGQTSAQVNSNWVVPAANVPSTSYSTYGYWSSIWDGIGGGFGANSSPLIQSGTSQDLSSSNAASYYAWYEVVGGAGDTGSEVEINNFPISPGDNVESWVVWANTNNGAANFTLCNYGANSSSVINSNQCVAYSVATPAPGNTTEWIVEAPTLDGSIIAPFTDIGPSATFTAAFWAATTNSPTTEFPGQPVSAGVSPTAITLSGSSAASCTPGALSSPATYNNDTFNNFTDYCTY